MTNDFLKDFPEQLSLVIKVLSNKNKKSEYLGDKIKLLMIFIFFSFVSISTSLRLSFKKKIVFLNSS